jgi:nitrate/nitrite transporter NarK
MKRLLWQFVATVVIVAVLWHFVWWIAAAVGIIALAVGLLVLAFYRAHRVDVRYERRAQLAARADQQHQWVMSGDDRGIYGPGGAELMRSIRSADDPTRAA